MPCRIVTPVCAVSGISLTEFPSSGTHPRRASSAAESPWLLAYCLGSVPRPEEDSENLSVSALAFYSARPFRGPSLGCQPLAASESIDQHPDHSKPYANVKRYFEGLSSGRCAMYFPRMGKRENLFHLLLRPACVILKIEEENNIKCSQSMG